MAKKGKKTGTIVMVVAILALVVFVCFITWLFFPDQDYDPNAPPGCGGSSGIVPTGCLGKSRIKNIQSTADCLEFEVRDCNGALLVIKNNCESGLLIGSEYIAEGEGKVLEFVRYASGRIDVVVPSGNFESYNPSTQDTLSVDAMLGTEMITITYTKENVCGEEKIPEMIGVEIVMEDSFAVGEKVTGEIYGPSLLFVGFEPYRIYNFDGEQWKYLDILEVGLPDCGIGAEKVCSEPQFPTMPIPEGCMVFEPDYDDLNWNQEYYEYQIIDCGEEQGTRSCVEKKSAGPGKYKVIYSYSEDCVSVDLFEAKENNVQTVEKEFQIV